MTLQLSKLKGKFYSDLNSILHSDLSSIYYKHPFSLVSHSLVTWQQIYDTCVTMGISHKSWPHRPGERLKRFFTDVHRIMLTLIHLSVMPKWVITVSLMVLQTLHGPALILHIKKRNLYILEDILSDSYQHLGYIMYRGAYKLQNSSQPRVRHSVGT